MLIGVLAVAAAAPESPASCDEQMSWIRGGPASLAHAARRARTDKFFTTTPSKHHHRYEFLYHAVLAPIARRVCEDRAPLRMLEIGLGCGMPQGPGGGVAVFRALLPPPAVHLDLHVFEFGASCALDWANRSRACLASDMHSRRPSAPGHGAATAAAAEGSCARRGLSPGARAASGGSTTVHIGDQNNTADLDAMWRAAGSKPFDVIIDDGSHHHEHQRTTITHALRQGMLASGGVYVIEDLSSSCYNYVSMEPGTHVHRAGAVGRSVGGTPDCMLSTSGRPTMFAQIVEWQKLLMHRSRRPLGLVSRIQMFEEAAAFHVRT
jgi:hypothetical protein